MRHHTLAARFLSLLLLLLVPWGLHACGGGETAPADPTPEPVSPPASGGATAVPVAPPAMDAGGATGAALSPALKAALEKVPAADRARTVPDGTDAAPGKAAYASQCASCHGAAGKGDGMASAFLDPRPGDWTDPARAGATTAGEKAWLIAHGVGGGSAMPGFGATMDEKRIWELVAFLGTLQ